jgi:hypothetical protein
MSSSNKGGIVNMTKELNTNISAPHGPSTPFEAAQRPTDPRWEGGMIMIVLVVVLLLSATQTAAFFGLHLAAEVLGFLVLAKGFGYAVAVDLFLFLTIRRARRYGAFRFYQEAKRWRWIALALTGFTFYCNFKFGYDAGGAQLEDWGAMIALFLQSMVPPVIMFLAAFMTTESGKQEASMPLAQRMAGLLTNSLGVVDAVKQVRDQRIAAQAPEKERKEREQWSRQIANPRFAARKAKERREAFMRQLGIEWEDEDGKALPDAQEQFATWEKLMFERGFDLLAFDAPERFRVLVADAKRLGIATAAPDAAKRFVKAEKAEREMLAQTPLPPTLPTGSAIAPASSATGSLASVPNSGYMVKDFAPLIGKSERTIRNWILSGTIHPDEVFTGNSGQQLIHPSAHLRLARELKQSGQITAARKGAQPMSRAALAQPAHVPVGQKTATK